MSRTKFPLTRRDRHVLRQIFETQGVGDDGSICSRPEPPIYSAPGPYDHPQFFQNQPHLEPQSPVPSSVFLPASPTRRQVQNGEGIYETPMPNSMSPGNESQADAGRISVGDISMPPSIPPSVPSEYQFQWPPNTTMDTIHEASIYGGKGERYEYKFDASCCDLFWCTWAIITYLFDVGSDIFVALMYFKTGHMWWFGLTLAFVVVPAVTMTIFSLVLYMRDWRVVGDKASPFRWASRVIFLFFQLGPLYRIIDTLYYGCKSRSADDEKEKQRFFERMVDEDVDSMMLRLFEAFMEAAPQVVLQLYVLTQNGLHDGGLLVALQIMSLISSLFTLSMSMVSFQKSLRQSQKLKANLTKRAMFFQFLWRLFTISSRVIALAMFAAHFKYFVFIVCGVHWLFMLIWILQQHTQYCVVRAEDGTEHHPKLFEFCFQVLAAFVHIFCYFNLLEGHTRLRALFFYTLTYLENAGMVLAWYIASSTSMFMQPEDYQGPVVGIVMGGFWVGIAIMLFYYKCIHPNNNSPFDDHEPIKWCVKCEDMSMCYEKPKDVVDMVIGEAVHPDELQHMTGGGDAGRDTSYERPETVRSNGPRKCVDPIPRTETPHNVSMSYSYRQPETYDSLVKLNTSKRSIDPNPRNRTPVGRSIAYKQPQTLDSLLQSPQEFEANNSTTV